MNNIDKIIREFELLQKEQMETGEAIAVLLQKQLVIAEKCRHIKQELEDLREPSTDNIEAAIRVDVAKGNWRLNENRGTNGQKKETR